MGLVQRQRMKYLLLRAPTLSSESEKWKFHVVVWETTSKIAPKACRTCSTIIFLHSANQIIDLWRCRGRCRRHFLKSSLVRCWIVVTSHCDGVWAIHLTLYGKKFHSFGEKFPWSTKLNECRKRQFQRRFYWSLLCMALVITSLASVKR